MNALQTFFAKLPHGFITSEEQLKELVGLHRLCLVLVRLGGPGGRFLAPAQNVRVLCDYCEKSGDWIRDWSIAPVELDRAAAWRPEPPPAMPPNYTSGRGGRLTISLTEPQKRQEIPDRAMFDERDCGGVFDGNQVISDADPGL
jgi:hypothetical protein